MLYKCNIGDFIKLQKTKNFQDSGEVPTLNYTKSLFCIVNNISKNQHLPISGADFFMCYML